MNIEKLQDTKEFYENSYSCEKLGAQRRWPNEEFCRFMGRNFFSKDALERKSINILEVGCGTGANLRLLAEEGFAAYGIELSKGIDVENIIPYNAVSYGFCGRRGKEGWDCVWT